LDQVFAWSRDCSRVKHPAGLSLSVAMPSSPVSPLLGSRPGERRALPTAHKPARDFGSYLPVPRSPKRLQSVDGLRAVALSLVFLNHATGTIAFPAVLAPITRDPHLGLAGHGVKFFFVISGFLITSILLRELDRSGTIDQMAFVRRRARRLLPALLMFISIVAVLRWAGVYSFAPRALLAALTFTGNIGAWELGHLWSMAVQEQFYLVWPLIVALGGRRLASRCAVAAVILVPIARVAQATLQPDVPSLYLGNGASFDTLALGCLLALHRDRLATRAWFNAAVESRWSIPLLYVLAGASLLIGWRPSVLLRAPMVTVAIVLLLERCIRHPDGRVARVLARRGLVYIGSASYSLYLWQQLFFNSSSALPLTTFPMNVITALAVGLLSWHLIERPLSTRASEASTMLGELRAAWNAGLHRATRATLAPGPRRPSAVTPIDERRRAGARLRAASRGT
jgi:peptidoglycan/LPS O-acetylase OafA/YrhL